MAREARNLTGKVVMVTGAARGIGAATARQLTEAGARVVVADLDELLAKETADALGATAVQLDVTDHDAFTAVLDQVEREVGPLDALVNNAGIMPIARVEDESGATASAQVAVNLLAVIHGSKEMVRRWKARGASGHIVNISSAAGRVPVAGAATYTGTKHAVSGFSNALQIELRADGVPIDVTAVHPVIVRTELAAGLGDTRGVPPIGPDDVAAAVVDALRHPRPDVYVPARLGRLVKLASVMPRGFSDFLSRAFKAERAVLDAIDNAARRDYEARIAPTAPKPGATPAASEAAEASEKETA
jgi:NAD(P)-dependent dehydrogenase (short-subunit alcohol dehydrogenase family)